MRKPKRVRFSDGEVDGVHVRDSPGRSDGPKTSEYAYFRKFKGGGDVHDHSRLLHKENEKLKRSKINNLITETGDAFGTPIEPSPKDLKISVSGERACAPDHNKLFLSPRVSKYGELDHRRQTEKSEKRSSLIYENVTPFGQSSFSSPFHEATKDSGNEYNEKGIFSEKRHRLRKLAAQTLFSEAEILHPKSKRIDFVTALMSRLFPKGNENSDSSKGVAYYSSKSLVFHKYHNLDKRLQLSSKRDWDMEIPKIMSAGSNKIIHPQWDSFVSGYHIPNHGTESRVQYLLDQQHPKSLSPYDRSKPSGSFIFKGLDEHSPSGELHRPLLEWNQKWEKDRLDTSIFNVNYAGFSTSSTIDQKRFTDNVINAKGPCLLYSNNFLEVASLPHVRDFRPDFDDVECALTEPGLSTSSNIDQKRFTDTVINAKGPSLLFSNHFLEHGSLPNARDFGPDYNVDCALGEPGLSTLNIDQRRFTDTVINAKGPSLLFSNHFLEHGSLPNARDFGPDFNVDCAPGEQGLFNFNIDQKRFTDTVINAKGPSLLFSNHFLEHGSLPNARDFGPDFNVDCAPGEQGLFNFNIDQKRFTDTVINAKGPRLLFSNHFLELDSLPNVRDFGLGFDDVKCALTEPGWFSLTLPKSITLVEEDRNEENILCNKNILWDGNGNPKSDNQQKCLSASDFSAEDYYYPPVFHDCQYPQDDSSLLCSFTKSPGKSSITPFSEGAFLNRNLLPSSHEYSSRGTFINRPLLLDRASCDRPDGRLYFGDG